MLERYFERDLSWLSFNHRVLQEAADTTVPLLERVKFLAIFSSNLEEFYRVRVANYYKLAQIERKNRESNLFYDGDPEVLIEKINRITDKMQQQFGLIFYEDIVPALRKENIHIIQSTSGLTGKQLKSLRKIYTRDIKPYIDLQKLDENTEPFLINTQVYFLIRTLNKDLIEYHLCKIPVEDYGRFIDLKIIKKRIILQIDDVVRYFLHQEIPGVLNCYAIKVTRDAELYLEEEFEGTVVEKIRRSLPKRETGSFTRMLYDENMPSDALKFLRNHFTLKKRNLVKGGRYHNFHDFFDFPKIDDEKLYYPKQKKLEHALIEASPSIRDLVLKEDVLLHFPYHDFNYAIRFLQEAIKDRRTKHIYITLYRVSDTSIICQLLIKACEKNIKVTVFDEVKARFDEASNIYWGEQLQKAGALVIYSFEDLKVHTKLLCIDQSNEKQELYLSYLSTGNFNSKTAKVYSDFAILTSDKIYGRDIIELFRYFKQEVDVPQLKELVVAPFGLRKMIEDLIDAEIAVVRSGLPGMLTFKMNSLQDNGIIKKLYEASRAGVKIRLIIRGICCLVPGVKGISENIKVKSIVDRHLEHARSFYSHSSDRLYLSSADMMTRNLNGRIEVTFEVKDKVSANIIKEIIELQWSDNVKARKINIRQSNPYFEDTKEKIRSQYATYELLQLAINAPVGEGETGNC